MTFEKLKRLRLMNIISFAIMMIVNIYMAFMPISGRSNVEIYKERNTLLPLTDRIVLISILILIGLSLYTKFQSGNIRFRENISAKCLNCLGWTFMGINILNILQILFFQLRWFWPAFIITILMFLLLRVINENIKDDDDVMDEKLYVRNPFSLYLGYETFVLFAMIAFIFNGVFGKDLYLQILVILMYAFTMLIAYRNRNLGILIVMILINIAIYPAAVDMYRWIIIISSLAMAAMIWFIHTSVKKEEDQKVYHPRRNAVH